jgi:hypothetical protein
MNFLRAGVRIPIQLPAEVIWKSRAGKYRRAQGETTVISANGLFVRAPIRLPRETRVEITVNLPIGVTKIPVELLCQARVVSQVNPNGSFGIGAIIDDYELRPAHRVD